MTLPKKIFNMNLVVKGPAQLKGYPFAYTSAYNCTSAFIGNISCIITKPIGDIKPLQISKMFSVISAKEGVDCLLFCPKLTAYQRRSLSGYGVAWISDEYNFHIPFLAASCKMSQSNHRLEDMLSAGAQQIVIHVLDGSWNGATSSNVSTMMGKSLSSVSSYFAEIFALDSSLIGSRGRTRFIKSPETSKEKRTIFERIEPYLSTPVKERLFLVTSNAAQELLDSLPITGMSALSKRTAITDDPWTTRAIAISKKKTLSEILRHTERVSKHDSPDVLLEIWYYEPDEEDLVSLYLALMDYATSEHDERIEEEVFKLKELIFDER